MFLLVAQTLAILLIILWWRMKPFYWREKGVPYMFPIPILGSVWGAAFDSFHNYWNKKYQKISECGGIVGYHNFDIVTLVVTDAEALKELAQKSECFMSRGIHSNPEYDAMAKNIFFISGEEWKRTRSKISPLFSPTKLKYMCHLMADNMKELINQIDNKALSKAPVEVNELSLKLSVDVVVNTIFGATPDSFTNPDSVFFKLQDDLFGHNFILRILLGTISPFIYDLFRVTSFPSKASNQIVRFISDTIEQRKKNIGVREDIVQGMLDLVKKESSFDSNVPKFSEKDCISQLMGLYLGGTEPPGNYISCLLFELAVNQNVQDEARKEIVKTLKSYDDKFTYDIVGKLPYTNMVINECLRKYPIVPVITRKCTKATSLKGINLEVGTGITVPLKSIHWDPKYYPEPEKFIPERFLTDEHKQNYVFMPFGVGTRMCIGMKMALMEIHYVICELLPRYKFLPCNKTTKTIEFGWKPTLNPKDGVWLEIEKL